MKQEQFTQDLYTQKILDMINSNILLLKKSKIPQQLIMKYLLKNIVETIVIMDNLSILRKEKIKNLIIESNTNTNNRHKINPLGILNKEKLTNLMNIKMNICSLLKIKVLDIRNKDTQPVDINHQSPELLKELGYQNLPILMKK